MWLQCAMWPICRLITVAPALCSGSAPIHTDCALANHSRSSRRGAAFSPYPIERHLAETSKMAAKDPNQIFQRMCRFWFFINFLRNGGWVRKQIDFMVYTQFCTMSLAPTSVLNNSFTSTFLTFLSFPVWSACVMWFVVSLSHYTQMLFASSIVLIFQNQLKVVKPDLFFYLTICLTMQSLDIKMNLQRNLLSKPKTEFNPFFTFL